MYANKRRQHQRNFKRLRVTPLGTSADDVIGRVFPITTTSTISSSSYSSTIVTTIGQSSSSSSSSNPSKRHRERLNGELETVAALLPYEEATLQRLDKLSVLRLAVSLLQIKAHFQGCTQQLLLHGQCAYHAGASGYIPVKIPLIPTLVRATTDLLAVAGSQQSGRGATTTPGQHFSQRRQQHPSNYQHQHHHPYHHAIPLPPTQQCPPSSLHSDVIDAGEATFTALASKALSGFVIMLNCDGEIFYASENIENYLGFMQSDLLHQPVFEIIHSEDRDELKRITQHAIENSSFYACNHARIVVRFRCLLDNTCGFLRVELRGTYTSLHPTYVATPSPNPFHPAACHWAQPPKRVFLCVGTPLVPPAQVEHSYLPRVNVNTALCRVKSSGGGGGGFAIQDETAIILKSRHSLDFSFLCMDTALRLILELTEHSDDNNNLGDKEGGGGKKCGRWTLPSHSGVEDSDATINSLYHYVHPEDSKFLAEAHENVLNCCSSGVMVYRLVSHHSHTLYYLQSGLRLFYKNGKPDSIGANHRLLTEFDAESLLEKRHWAKFRSQPHGAGGGAGGGVSTFDDTLLQMPQKMPPSTATHHHSSIHHHHQLITSTTAATEATFASSPPSSPTYPEGGTASSGALKTTFGGEKVLKQPNSRLHCLAPPHPPSSSSSPNGKTSSGARAASAAPTKKRKKKKGGTLSMIYSSATEKIEQEKEQTKRKRGNQRGNNRGGRKPIWTGMQLLQSKKNGGAADAATFLGENSVNHSNNGMMGDGTPSIVNMVEGIGDLSQVTSRPQPPPLPILTHPSSANDLLPTTTDFFLMPTHPPQLLHKTLPSSFAYHPHHQLRPSSVIMAPPIHHSVGPPPTTTPTMMIPNYPNAAYSALVALGAGNSSSSTTAATGSDLDYPQQPPPPPLLMVSPPYPPPPQCHPSPPSLPSSLLGANNEFHEPASSSSTLSSMLSKYYSNCYQPQQQQQQQGEGDQQKQQQDSFIENGHLLPSTSFSKPWPSTPASCYQLLLNSSNLGSLSIAPPPFPQPLLDNHRNTFPHQHSVSEGGSLAAPQPIPPSPPPPHPLPPPSMLSSLFEHHNHNVASRSGEIWRRSLAMPAENTKEVPPIQPPQQEQWPQQLLHNTNYSSSNTIMGTPATSAATLAAGNYSAIPPTPTTGGTLLGYPHQYQHPRYWAMTGVNMSTAAPVAPQLSAFSGLSADDLSALENSGYCPYFNSNTSGDGGGSGAFASRLFQQAFYSQQSREHHLAAAGATAAEQQLYRYPAAKAIVSLPPPSLQQ